MKCVKGHEVEVLRSNAGWYIGTEAPDPECENVILPNCRVSCYYYGSREEAQAVLDSGMYARRDHSLENEFCNGGGGCFTQMPRPTRHTASIEDLHEAIGEAEAGKGRTLK